MTTWMPTLSARALWNEPAVADAPGPLRRDWALVGAMLIAAVVEFIVRDEIVWPVVSIAVFLAVVVALPWRRQHPFAITVAFFGTVGVLTALQLALDVDWEGLYSAVVVLVLPYCLFRWGAGRHALIGLLVLLSTATVSMFQPDISVGDIIGGYLVLLFPALLGLEIRTLGQARAQQIDQARSTEREQLARELHDTVAHHVSAIAVQAQAGQAVAPVDPEAAVTALSVIEEEASRTLAEMRGIVGALRGDGADFAPQPGIADLDRLARATTGLPVDIETHGELSDLGPTVDAAIYRLVQESVTNAVRHARNASAVRVRIDGEAEAVRLRIHDDGDPVGANAASSGGGYGLVGMHERASLLGGTITAGPDNRRGWTVHAVLPRTANAKGSRA